MSETAKILAIRDGSPVLVFKTKSWGLPGGRTNGKEKTVVAARREAKEELPRAKVVKMKCWKRFNLRARGKRLSVTVYTAEITGPLTTGAEINAAARIPNWRKVALNPTTKIILEAAAKYGLL